MAKTTKTEAPATKQEEKKAAPADPKFYKLGEKKYSPRVEHNEVAWDKVNTVLIKGKGRATHAQLAKALEHHFSKVDEDHVNFISYMTRRGSLVEVAKK